MAATDIYGTDIVTSFPGGFVNVNDPIFNVNCVFTHVKSVLAEVPPAMIPQLQELKKYFLLLYTRNSVLTEPAKSTASSKKIFFSIFAERLVRQFPKLNSNFDLVEFFSQHVFPPKIMALCLTTSREGFTHRRQKEY